jgi:hypothetical protein
MAARSKMRVSSMITYRLVNDVLAAVLVLQCNASCSNSATCTVVLIERPTRPQKAEDLCWLDSADNHLTARADAVYAAGIIAA